MILLTVCAGCFIVFFGQPGASAQDAGADTAADDTDGDGLTDEWETAYGLNATDPADGAGAISDAYGEDSDGDGIIDGREDEVEQRYRDNPPLVDTFFVTMLLAIAPVAIIVGAVAAYYGTGKTRAIGAIFGALGVIDVLAVTFIKHLNGRILGLLHWGAVDITLAFITVLGAVLGIAISMLAFYWAVMRG